MNNDLFYIQDTRDIVGNDFLWWRDGGGYTANIEEAEVFDYEMATHICKSRQTDRMWPKDYIDARVIKVIDSQRVNYRDAMSASVTQVK